MPLFILGSIVVSESTAETSTLNLMSLQRSNTALVLEETDHDLDAKMAVLKKKKVMTPFKDYASMRKNLQKRRRQSLKKKRKLQMRRRSDSNKFTLVKMQCAHRKRRRLQKRKLQRSQASQLQS